MDPRGRGEGWPRAGGAVVLAAQGPRIMADVTSATSRSLLLRPNDSVDVPEAAPHGTPAIIEYVSEARAYRLSGQLEGGEPDGVMRFVVTSRPVFLQRREHVRAPIDVVMVLASQDSNVRLVGRSRNLSVGGALGDFPQPPAAGQRLRFSLVPRTGRVSVKGVCRVLRVDDPSGVAVQFEDVTSEQAGHLAEFILRHRGGAGQPPADVTRRRTGAIRPGRP